MPALVMFEAGLTIKARKKRVYVQLSTREAWTTYLDKNPRNSDMSDSHCTTTPTEDSPSG